jgi:hypothetical protein
MQDERATRETVWHRQRWPQTLWAERSFRIRLDSDSHGTIFSGLEPAEQHGGVRGGKARDPPPAGGGGPPQLPGGGAHQPQEDRREAARGGARIPTGVCGLFVNFF